MADRRRVLSLACRAGDLEQQLAASIALLESGARFVDPATLPREVDLHAAHAQLARNARERRSWRYE